MRKVLLRQYCTKSPPIENLNSRWLRRLCTLSVSSEQIIIPKKKITSTKSKEKEETRSKCKDEARLVLSYYVNEEQEIKGNPRSK